MPPLWNKVLQQNVEPTRRIFTVTSSKPEKEHHVTIGERCGRGYSCNGALAGLFKDFDRNWMERRRSGSAVLHGKGEMDVCSRLELRRS